MRRLDFYFRDSDEPPRKRLAAMAVVFAVLLALPVLCYEAYVTTDVRLVEGTVVGVQGVSTEYSTKRYATVKLTEEETVVARFPGSLVVTPGSRAEILEKRTPLFGFRLYVVKRAWREPSPFEVRVR
jgi:hypothetical protein